MQLESTSSIPNEIYNLAIETFDSHAQADIWFNTFHQMLNDTALGYAKTDPGVLEVKKILQAIKDGSVV